ncbi:hypothetical protein B0O80DRAFT_446236 [Mortierella sp. GBAus27b]|nr:hypothetical protein B0O80DRAFT_446236 [Mortierella sp. GBAus27b]
MIGEGVGRMAILALLRLLVAIAVVVVTAAAAAVVLPVLGNCTPNGESGAIATDEDRARPEMGFLIVPGDVGFAAKGRIPGDAFVIVTRTGPPPPTVTAAEVATPGGGRGITCVYPAEG